LTVIYIGAQDWEPLLIDLFM